MATIGRPRRDRIEHNYHTMVQNHKNTPIKYLAAELNLREKEEVESTWRHFNQTLSDEDFFQHSKDVFAAELDKFEKLCVQDDGDYTSVQRVMKGTRAFDPICVMENGLAVEMLVP